MRLKLRLLTYIDGHRRVCRNGPAPAVLCLRPGLMINRRKGWLVLRGEHIKEQVGDQRRTVQAV